MTISGTYREKVLVSEVTQKVRYCTFHGGLGRNPTRPIEEDWCWWEYRHECRRYVVEATLTYRTSIE